MNPESVQCTAYEPPSTRPRPGGSRRGGVYRFVRAVAIGCMVCLAASACSRRPPSASAKPATPEQLAAAQRAQEEKEAAERVAAEQDALAKQAEEEEAKRQQEIEKAKLPAEFGTPSVIAEAGKKAPAPGGAAAAPVETVAPVLVPQKLPPPHVEGATPYDQAFPPVADRVVRIGIVSGSSQATSAQDVARMLSTEDRKYLEETLGLGVKIAYVSETDRPETRNTRVYYGPQFFKAAVHIAALLPQPQQIIAMSDAEALRHGVDVLVQIGTDLR